MRRLMGAHAELFRRLRVFGWPLIDVLVRVALAQAFFVSGLLKVSNWSNALYLSSHEYPVAWLDPTVAAYAGASIELIGAGLLAAGLLTRFAALAMMMLTWVVQSNYVALDQQLFSAALFGWYALHGAGPVSLDRLMSRGFADSAIPFAGNAVRLCAWVSLRLAPLYLSLLRAWIGASLLLAGQGVRPLAEETFSLPWLALPLSTAMSVACAWAVAAGLLLLAGLATRYVAIVLALLFAAGAVMQASAAQDLGCFATLALLAIFGAGPISLDALAARWGKRRFPELDGKPAFSLEGLPRVVIVGAGFGGLSCAGALRRARAAVTLIDRGNHHLFQPLLYQVATAALSPGDIAAPIRPLFRDVFNTRVLLGTVTAVDTARHCVRLGDREIAYDFLVLATGAAHSYFGKDHWQRHAPGLKRIEDATAIRRRVLTAFEQAEVTDDPLERASLLTFLIVGGGPTGVELAGAIAELARFGMDKEFRQFDPANAKVILVQSAARVLPAFDEKLARLAQRSLERLGVEVLLGSRVADIDAAGVWVDGRRISARTVLWAAGVTASPAAQWVGAQQDAVGRVVVESDLRVKGMDNVYALGDTAASSAWAGRPVPGLAPAAKQGGAYVAKVILARLASRAPPGPFLYRHRGSLATIGRSAAVADFGRIKLWGAPAWWLWGIIHVGFLVGVRNRVATMLNWFWAYLTFGGRIRLITGSDSSG